MARLGNYGVSETARLVAEQRAMITQMNQMWQILNQHSNVSIPTSAAGLQPPQPIVAQAPERALSLREVWRD